MDEGENNKGKKQKGSRDITIDETNSTYGPWMVASRKGRFDMRKEGSSFGDSNAGK